MPTVSLETPIGVCARVRVCHYLNDASRSLYQMESFDISSWKYQGCLGERCVCFTLQAPEGLSRVF